MTAKEIFLKFDLDFIASLFEFITSYLTHEISGAISWRPLE